MIFLIVPDWDENEIHSPLIDKIGEPILLLDSAPFGEALPLDVDVPVSPNRKMDDFIDDTIIVGHNNERWRRLVGASLLAVHVFGCPLHSDEHVPREDLVALKALCRRHTFESSNYTRLVSQHTIIYYSSCKS